MAFRAALLFVLFTSIADARPSSFGSSTIHATTGGDIDLAIYGGTDAEEGAWPWQLSQQRLSGTTWSHSCGASLLSSTLVLSAAHCVDGSAASSLRVIAGLYRRSDTTGTQTSVVESYKVHENYLASEATFANDIAILTLQTAIEIGGNVATATLPPDAGDEFSGDTCIITGWGKITETNALSDVLQQADVTILTTDECQEFMGTLATVWDAQLCVYNSNNVSGACNGDSGGPANCPDGSGGYYVTGITSWVMSSSGACVPSYPSVYTRVTSYLDWIEQNTQI
jgi:secreted trypsin-like serine protease